MLRRIRTFFAAIWRRVPTPRNPFRGLRGRIRRRIRNFTKKFPRLLRASGGSGGQTKRRAGTFVVAVVVSAITVLTVLTWGIWIIPALPATLELHTTVGFVEFLAVAVVVFLTFFVSIPAFLELLAWIEELKRRARVHKLSASALRKKYLGSTPDPGFVRFMQNRLCKAMNLVNWDDQFDEDKDDDRTRENKACLRARVGEAQKQLLPSLLREYEQFLAVQGCIHSGDEDFPRMRLVHYLLGEDPDEEWATPIAGSWLARVIHWDAWYSQLGVLATYSVSALFQIPAYYALPFGAVAYASVQWKAIKERWYVLEVPGNRMQIIEFLGGPTWSTLYRRFICWYWLIEKLRANRRTVSEIEVSFMERDPVTGEEVEVTRKVPIGVFPPEDDDRFILLEKFQIPLHRSTVDTADHIPAEVGLPGL